MRTIWCSKIISLRVKLILILCSHTIFFIVFNIISS